LVIDYFMRNLFDKKTKLIFLFIFLAELFSIFAFWLPDFEKAAFFIIAGLVLILSLINPPTPLSKGGIREYGILILLAELFIGSKGYLFYFESGGIIISIRLALWLIVMAVWLANLLIKWARNRELPETGFGKQNSYFYYFIILLFFIVWGAVNGFLNHNSFSNIFFDFNGWLYFALIFPIYDFIKNKENIYDLGRVFLAATIWLSAKTLFLLFAFSHNLAGATLELYKWVRGTGVGEITLIQGGFYRVFFQSHIFVLIGFFILLAFFSNQLFKNKKFLTFLPRPPRHSDGLGGGYFLFLTSSLSVILVSFSRSFWLGLAIGLLFYYFIILLFYKWKVVFRISAVLLAGAVVAAVLTLIIVKFPYPKPIGGFDAASLFSERISDTKEAAVSSRWQLLPPLWTAIKQNPVLGSGFGATVTYESKDPRVLASSPSGEYTTYAFEWGWLDIWLKLGFFGLLAYLLLISKITFDSFMARNSLAFGLGLGLIVIAAISFFSPYTNHPLGIGYLIIAAAVIERLETGATLA